MRTWLGLIVLVVGASACASSSRASYRHRPNVGSATEIASDRLPPAATCTGLDDTTWRTSLFANRRDIVAVEKLQRLHRVGARITIERLSGARVVIAASPSVNVQWLERVARCQLDTYAAAGQSPADEPLSVPDARVTVVALNGSYGIDVTSEDWDAAREIYNRASALQ